MCTGLYTQEDNANDYVVKVVGLPTFISSWTKNQGVPARWMHVYSLTDCDQCQYPPRSTNNEHFIVQCQTPASSPKLPASTITAAMDSYINVDNNSQSNADCELSACTITVISANVLSMKSRKTAKDWAALYTKRRMAIAGARELGIVRVAPKLKTTL